ncbi:MAG: ParB/RepB/Spo0J family partition protein [Pseudomonadota bacterium]
MSKKHDLYDEVLGAFETKEEAEPARANRFLKRSTGLGERLSGEVEEKTLRWVDPATCVMWERHNRAYDLLTEENCRDLIDGIKAQGRQEFPAIVRQRGEGYEVICGARRHFAVTWLRANNYTQFKYLVEVRDLSDEEAFRLADIENRDREDISDYERAIDYADAIERYYGGKQKAMAARLEVSPPWLSRYLALAALPQDIVRAFASLRDLRERHARELKPLLADQELAKPLLEEARALAREQTRSHLDGAAVMKRLKAAVRPKVEKAPASDATFARSRSDKSITMLKRGRRIRLEFDADMSASSLRGAFEKFLAQHGG